MDSEFEFYSDEDFDQELPPIPKSLPNPSFGLKFKPRMRDSILLKKQSINGDHKTEMAKHLEEIEKSILEFTEIHQVQKPNLDPEAKFWKSSKPSSLRKPSNASNVISEFVRNLEVEGFTIGSPVEDQTVKDIIPSSIKSPVEDKPVKDIIPSSIKVDDKSDMKSTMPPVVMMDDKPDMKSTMSPAVMMDDKPVVKNTDLDEKPVKRTANIPPRKNSKAVLPPPVPSLEDIKNYDEIYKGKVKDEKAVTKTIVKDTSKVAIQTITLEEILNPRASPATKKESKSKRSGRKNEESNKKKIPQKQEPMINTINIDQMFKKEAPTEKRSEKNVMEEKPRLGKKENNVVSSEEGRLLVKDKSSPEKKEKEDKPVARKGSTSKPKKDLVTKHVADTEKKETDDLETKNESGVEVLPSSTDDQEKTYNSNSDSERENARVELLGKLKARSPTETSNNQIPDNDIKDYEEGVVDLLDVYYPSKKHILSMAIHDIFDVYDPALSSEVPTIAEEELETATSAYTDSLILLYNPLAEDKPLNPLAQTRKKLPPRGKSSKTIKLRKPKINVDGDVPKPAINLERKPSGSRPDLDRLNLGAKEKLR